MSSHSRLSSISSIDDLDFERISSPEAESFEEAYNSPRREESPVLVDAEDIKEELEEREDHNEELRRLHQIIANLQQRLAEQKNLYQGSLRDNENLREEIRGAGVQVAQLTRQLEEEKRKQWEIEEEKARIRAVRAENLELKQAMERLEKLSLNDKIKAEQAEPDQGGLDWEAYQASVALNALGGPSQPNIWTTYFNFASGLPASGPALGLSAQPDLTSLNQKLAEKDLEIANLKAEIEQRNQAKVVRRANKEERKKNRLATYGPYGGAFGGAFGGAYGGIYKTQQQLSEELQLADQQIGIIVEHNDYLRTVEANEHSQELCRLRNENEQLNATIVFLKQQLSL
ncbi:hypothetical protein CAEBREN_24980 [Caenorhabditis brenneri]|uniref:Uncharacterized protein n=1 Tax=Caenorhabditis brenneri TaxID=135651 RepID=G0PIG3_CAEBE|nr:hypothetical protein CAEBREN_24980 [Caenorhabditis brenneri]